MPPPSRARDLAEPGGERLIVRKDAAGKLLDPAVADHLRQQARQAGERQRYIVQLRTDDIYDPQAMGADAALEAAVRTRSERDMDALASHFAARNADVTEVHRALPLPLLVVEADDHGLQALIDTADVQVIYQDVIMRPFLHETLPIIQAGTLHSAGGTGAGHAVAVLDSGVQLSHTIFSGKIVGQACFASGFPGYAGCPSGHGYGSTTPGAGETCSGSDQCVHGTHVAAIAVGAQRTTSQGPAIKGVAPSASLVSIRTGSVYLDDFSVERVGYHLSDTVTALNWVYDQRDSLSIAAVNMSYGEYPARFGHCDSWFADLAQQVDLLTGADVAVVAASGNDAEYSPTTVRRMPAPACIENVISVAAVDKDSVFAPYSNVSTTLDLMAPGGRKSYAPGPICTGDHQCVLSAITGSSYGYSFGTSMAAPHVAGTIAGLRSLWPKYDTSVGDIVQHLKDTGQPVTFSQGGTVFTKPLVKLSNALASPTTPGNLAVAREYCYGSNHVSWTASSGSLTHYQVQGSHTADFLLPFPLFSGLGTSATVHVDASTWVRVRACDGLPCSAWRNGTTTAEYYPYCL